MNQGRTSTMEVQGKGAFITGGASGMGLGMATAFAEAGMRVVIADVRADALRDAVAMLHARGLEVTPVRLDVTSRTAWVQAAEKARKAIGNIHVLALNAGVGLTGPIRDATFKDWDFGLGVNLGGVVNGLMTMLPRMIDHGEDGYIFATSSTGGFSAIGGAAIYCTAKFAIAGLMETLATELAGSPLAAGVVFPGLVQTGLLRTTAETRPAHLRNWGAEPPVIPAGHDDSDEKPLDFDPALLMSSEELGRRVLDGVRRRDLFIMTHAEFKDGLAARSAAMMRAMPREPADRARADFTRTLGTLLFNPVYDTQGPQDPAADDGGEAWRRLGSQRTRAVCTPVPVRRTAP